MTVRSHRRAWWLAGLLAVAAMPVAADTLVLRSGDRVEGDLVSVRDDTIEFREGKGFFGARVQRYSRDDVARIELDRFGGGRPDEPTRPTGMREKDVTVLAAQQWTDTGVDVRRGQAIYFEASGRVRWGADRRDGPEGESGSHRNPNRPIPSRPGGALVGKVGESSSDAFFVGNEKGAIEMRSSGRLFLGINDDHLQDNSGSFRVVVYY